MKHVRLARLHVRLGRRGREMDRVAGDAPVGWETPDGSLSLEHATTYGLRIRNPRGRYPSLQKVPLPPPARLRSDAVKLLLREREADRPALR